MTSHIGQKNFAMDSDTSSYSDTYAATLIPSDLFDLERLERSSTPHSSHPGDVPSDHSSLRIPSPPTTYTDSSVLDDARKPSSQVADTPGSNVAPPPSSKAPSIPNAGNPSARFGHLTRDIGHPPFEDFKERVYDLWKSLAPLQLWKKASKPTSYLDSRLGRFICSNTFLGRAFPRRNSDIPDCAITQMRGGSFNRVIGVKIPDSYSPSSNIDRGWIVRIPRDRDAQLDREVATLDYVRDYTSIPVPEVVHKDYTSDNPLGFPYLIQKRIPGRPLSSVWDDLNVEQRCSVARDIAKTLRKLQHQTHPIPGVITAQEPLGDGFLRTTVAPYDLDMPKGRVDGPKLPDLCDSRKISIPDLIQHQIKRWVGVELEQPPKKRSRWWEDRLEYWEKLSMAATEMDIMGLLKDKTFSLCHLDFQPRNIMAEIRDNQTVKITGYLDWDSAVIAPSFVGCAPPTWMWFEGEEANDEENERGANNEPGHEINIKVKEAFEEAAGRDWNHYAYDPRFRLARLLFRIAKDGIWHPIRISDAHDFLDSWDMLQKLLLPEPPMS